MEVFLYILLGILIFFLAVLAICGSVFAGFISSVFASFFSVVKNCYVGIYEEVSHPFIRVMLYIALSLTVLIILAPVVIFIIGIIMAMGEGCA